MITGLVVKCDNPGCKNEEEIIDLDKASVEIIGDKMLVLDRYVCNACIRAEKVKA